MFGKVREIQFPGELIHECLVIDIDEDLRGREASISKLSFGNNSDPVETRYIFKLGDLIRKGDVVMLLTVRGIPSTKPLQGNRILHLQYLNMGSAIWGETNCTPSLTEIIRRGPN